MAVVAISTPDRRFAHVGSASSDIGRQPTAPAPSREPRDDDAPAATQRGRVGFMEREMGVEPATLILGKPKGTKK